MSSHMPGEIASLEDGVKFFLDKHREIDATLNAFRERFENSEKETGIALKKRGER
jgi:hypothetical protein